MRTSSVWIGPVTTARPGSVNMFIFAAHTEFRKVDSRLHGEAGVGQNQAIVVGLEVVEIGSVAMGLGGDAVPGAMSEVFCETGVAYHCAGGIVRLPSR